jgi:hypothetical protein
VAKPQPGQSSGGTENALEVEDLFTDGAGAGGAYAGRDLLGGSYVALKKNEEVR